MLTEITRNLYSEETRATLYHYTSFTGFLGIVDARAMWASDVRYMNDSAELRHTADLLRKDIGERIANGCSHPYVLNEFLDWVVHRITNGHMLFATSFRAHGNLLSQWRGYSLHGKGVSVGLSADHVWRCAEQQNFQVGRCIYDPVRQSELIHDIVEAVIEQTAGASGPSNTEGRQAIFEELETDLLRIAAVLKHPSFQEEDEWRVVSHGMRKPTDGLVRFREGTSMLVPYVFLDLRDEQGRLPFEHIFVGPTPNHELSLNSLQLYLSQRNCVPADGIDYCQIPFRQR
ncbi:DUF2971 domain-containing protein [Allohahella marinimesophila]|uniref:DUF2971 domain-containing protein n=1 Tax=Allohahella marinimesophila TaxID=1054972 RepID=A0ABP7PD75_9GAMM